MGISRPMGLHVRTINFLPKVASATTMDVPVLGVYRLKFQLGFSDLQKPMIQSMQGSGSGFRFRRGIISLIFIRYL